MRALLRMIWSTVLVVMLSGCMDRIYLEDATLSLMVGLDVNEKNELLVYMTSPVFSEEAKEKSEEYGVRASTIRESRMGFDEIVTALTVSGKIQVLILGQRLLQHPDWFRLLDVVFRDAKFSVNARMVALDGPVSEMFEYRPKDKPRLALHVTKLIDTANYRNLTVKTRAQEFHRQMFEPGITPTITELRKEKRAVKVMGTAMLTENGVYAGLIEPRNTLLLQMMLHEKQGEISVTIPIQEQNDQKSIVAGKISFFVKGVNKKVKTTYRDGKFQFDIQMGLDVSISERMFPYNMEKDYKKLEKMMEAELRKDYDLLVKKCQAAKTDPFGFGLYARAYEYKQWKKIEKDWPKAFSEAAVHFKPKVSIKGNGVTK
ncbi:Ger(x)C family spore germination protein [Brevibacillus fortis]|uniref:Ger(x)C family spore germination protein n=1 Tax=Brevibacillus fortis TaxID=2126352 RepID=UPI002E238546|nr:Ger(x)C family spore germination protein [Brevibacillus fortis]